MTLPLTPAVFSILSGLIEDQSGLHYDHTHADLLADRVSARALERGFESLLDYYYFLRYDAEGPRELEALVDTLVVNETYFFRELTPLTALVDHYLAPRTRTRTGKRVRVWCGAASTGEEPLTLAMLLAERGLLDRVDIVASDISDRALAHARRGAFGRRSLRAVQPGYERWLTVEGDKARVAPALVEAIKWRRVNLLAPPPELAEGSFDAILCRNVLIYFSLDTTARVVEQLARRLTPDGVLLVGVSESLLRLGTLLRCEERGGVFFYERTTP